MVSDVFGTLEDVGMDDRVLVTLDVDSVTVHGVQISSPFTTSVDYVSEDTLDHKKGDDVDGIVHQRIVHLEPVSGDGEHDEYVIETRSPSVGDKSVSPVRARDWFEGQVDDGQYTTSTVAGIDAIEVV